MLCSLDTVKLVQKNVDQHLLTYSIFDNHLYNLVGELWLTSFSCVPEQMKSKSPKIMIDLCIVITAMGECEYDCCND